MHSTIHKALLFFFSGLLLIAGCAQVPSSTCEVTHQDSRAGSACTYNGKSYNPGDSFPDTDGVNQCTCESDGEVMCTLVGN